MVAITPRFNPTAVHTASQVAYHWPTTTMLRPPTVVGIASGVMGAVIPYQFNVPPPTPDGTPHATKHFTFTKVATKPKVEPVSKPDAGNVIEVVLGIIVVLMIARRVYVWLLDSAGNVLARLDG